MTAGVAGKERSKNQTQDVCFLLLLEDHRSFQPADQETSPSRKTRGLVIAGYSQGHGKCRQAFHDEAEPGMTAIGKIASHEAEQKNELSPDLSISLCISHHQLTRKYGFIPRSMQAPLAENCLKITQGRQFWEV